ncbi:MAG: DUF5060 domain-containing protein [Thermoguttaceae bacterium]|nr:DUF5060 domain-containing protein [Thermoguttaceae bacterium]MDW8078935.1 DUF5060 domain-containing protein [Thermoguttaceae bacterium]
MNRITFTTFAATCLVGACLHPQSLQALEPPRKDGDGSVTISGELRRWHKVTLSLSGPYACERDSDPNPFTDYSLTVAFRHESGEPIYLVPGYFAADGNAAETSAEAGNVWRAHFAPDKTGRWSYRILFLAGKHVAIGGAGVPLAPYHGQTGFFVVEETDKAGRDFRAKGRLAYVGKHHLQFLGSGEYFLKAGADAPETLLAYVDFDGTIARRANAPLKTWSAHIQDWQPGNPVWQGQKGKGLIGALNYLASKGVNGISFITYNAGGDGDNVWPFVDRDDKLHYDCSKLDQWGIVFDHATAIGLHLHFKLQEQEMDDNRREKGEGFVPEALDGGKLGPERKLYLRELIARFAHNLALTWNIGEENTQSPEEQREMIRYIWETDPYKHPIVVHTFPNWQDRVYRELLGGRSLLTGASLQNSWQEVHRRTLRWIWASAEAGRPWVVANDEQNPAELGVPPDPGYAGFDGIARLAPEAKGYTLDDIRKYTLWGNLMAGGGGVEYYFGYRLPQNDLDCEDFRSRDRSWDYCRYALEFFVNNKIPFWDMKNANHLVGNLRDDNSRWCLALAGKVYVVYLPSGGSCELDLSHTEGTFEVGWYNPRQGGPLQKAKVAEVTGGKPVILGPPPSDENEDWAILVRKVP